MADAIKNKQNYISMVGRFMVAAVACWILYLKIDPPRVADTFKQLHPGILVVAVIIFLIVSCFIGFRWWIFMRAQDIRVSIWLAIKLTFLGLFFSNFMPSAVGGDVIRAWYVSRYTHRRLQAMLGVAVDRLMGLVSTFILALCSYTIFMRGEMIFHISQKQKGILGSFFEKHPISLYHVFLFFLLAIGIVFLLSGMLNLKRMIIKLYRHVIHFLDQLKEVIFIYYHHPWILANGLLMTILVQSLVILSLWLIGRDLGMTAGIRFYFVFFPVVWVIGSIPISIAGIGILEGGIVLLFVQFTGAAPEAAIALALCQRLTWIVASILGLLVHISGTHRRYV